MSTKKKLNITIDESLYNLFKHKPNISRYIQEVLYQELAENHKDVIAIRVKNELMNNDDFKRSVKDICHDYMEERRRGDWNDWFMI